MSPVRHRRKRRSPGPRRVPAGSRCDCSCSIQAALEMRNGKVVCYECARQAEGRQRNELHHVWPWAIDPQTMIQVPGNMHRAIEAEKSGWPTVILTNRSQEPLLLTITTLLVIRDFTRVLWQHYLQPIIDWLLQLYEALRGHHGLAWAEELGVANPLWSETGL
jgi:hypothetical protein